MTDIDFVVRAGIAVTMNARRELISDAAVAVDKGAIVEVGKARDIDARYRARKSLGGADKLVTPGFIDCHDHAVHFLSKGMIDDMRYPERWRDRVWPYEAGLSADETRLASLGTFIEMIRHGTTCFSDPGALHPTAVAKAAAEVGIRGVVSHLTWDVHDPTAPEQYNWDTQAALEQGERTVTELQGFDGGRIKGFFSLVRGTHVTDALCSRVKERADALGVGIHAHCASTKSEFDAAMRNWGFTPVERFNRVGVLGPTTQLVHMGYLTDEDIAKLGKADVSVCHCPSASMFGGFGCIAHGRFPELVEAGVRVVLGTDASAVSRFLDMVRVMYLVACAHKDAKIDPTVIGAHRALEMATIQGARAVLWDRQIGSLETGKRADLLVIDTDAIEWQPDPFSTPVANLVYSASGTSVRSVLIDGRLVMEDRRITMLDEHEYLRQARQASRAILGRIGAAPRLAWPVS